MMAYPVQIFDVSMDKHRQNVCYPSLLLITNANYYLCSMYNRNVNCLEEILKNDEHFDVMCFTKFISAYCVENLNF